MASTTRTPPRQPQAATSAALRRSPIQLCSRRPSRRPKSDRRSSPGPIRPVRVVSRSPFGIRSSRRTTAIASFTPSPASGHIASRTADTRTQAFSGRRTCWSSPMECKSSSTASRRCSRMETGMCKRTDRSKNHRRSSTRPLLDTGGGSSSGRQDSCLGRVHRPPKAHREPSAPSRHCPTHFSFVALTTSRDSYGFPKSGCRLKVQFLPLVIQSCVDHIGQRTRHPGDSFSKSACVVELQR